MITNQNELFAIEVHECTNKLLDWSVGALTGEYDTAYGLSFLTVDWLDGATFYRTEDAARKAINSRGIHFVGVTFRIVVFKRIGTKRP